MPAPATASPAAPVDTALRLWVVTLPWNRNDLEEGDYSDRVWAPDADAAVTALAEQMAGDRVMAGRQESAAERQAFVNGLVADAPRYAAMEVAQTVLEDVKGLLEGPAGAMTADAQLRYDQICELLGSVLPQSRNGPRPGAR